MHMFIDDNEEWLPPVPLRHPTMVRASLNPTEMLWLKCVLILALICLSSSAWAQTVPNMPVNLAASVMSDFQISLSWVGTSANEDGFKIEQSLDGTDFSQIAQVQASVTNYLNSGLFPGTTYYYRVRAYNSAGNSAYGNVASAQTTISPCPFSVVAWGDNSEGEAVPPPAMTGAVAIAGGLDFSLALQSNGTVVGWGSDADGEIDVPSDVTNVVAIAAGTFHSLALQSNGTVVGWGFDGFGEATPPAGLSGVVAVAGGLYHSLALKSDGTVVAWGAGKTNNPSDGFDYGQSIVPAGLSNVVAISAGLLHSMALKSDGTVVCWGDNTYGETTVPAGLSGVIAVAGGYDHSLALKSNGTVVGWGYNGFGETTPPAGLSSVVAIAAGGFHSLALTSGGTAIGWGDNDEGEEMPPAGLTGIGAIAAGFYHSLALATSPAPPSGFSANLVAANEVDLLWNEYSSGVEQFEIDRAPDAGGVPGTWAPIATLGATATNYSDTTVIPNTLYWYRIQAQNSCNDSAFAVARIVLGILDDTWISGVRTVQNLPASSAWFSSSAGSLNAAPGAMTLTVSGSVMVLTYFTPASSSPPVTLNVGDTLTTTISFTFNGVPTVASSSQGFRIAVVNFADGSNVPLRVAGDGFSSGSQGLNVAGYTLFQKMYTSFSDTAPMNIRKRTNLSDASLLGTTGDWTSLASGGDTNAFFGFANQTPYTLQIALARTSLSSLAITTTWSNELTGAILTLSAIDSAATNFSFDGIAFRPQNNTTAAATNVFTEVKIGVTSTPLAPAIVGQPQDASVSAGQNATFTVVPNGTLPLSYQWYYDTDTPVANGTNATLTLTNIQPAQAGSYLVVITNSYGSATSAAAALMVNVPPSISTQPAGLTVIPGQSAIFSVVANGSQPLSYQWYFNGSNSPLIGATSSTLTLTNVQAAEAGNYFVIVSNAASSVASSNAALVVNTSPTAPVFILQPLSLTVRQGGDTAFTAAALGTQPISYQWDFNGTPVPDADSNTLSLVDVQLTNGGNYTVVASNGIGATTSVVARLTVVPLVPPLPVIPTNEFVITDYGAIGDGVTDNTTAIQNTINAASASGGGVVIVPTGGPSNIYLSGPITLASEINLQVNNGAMLQMLPRSSWPGSITFINGSGLHDVEISGTGAIDGQGAAWWPGAPSGRPNFINFGGCSNILIENVTLQNPPTFHLMLKGNNVNLTIQGITINTPGDSPNTDGMDLASVHVLIQNCFISDGDDNIEIGGSGGPASDITVTNCTFGTGHGVSIGSITSGGVSNLTVINCTFNGTDNGIRMKSDNDRGGLVQNLAYCNLAMTNVGYPIVIYSYYNEVGTPNRITPQIAMSQPTGSIFSTTPIWRNIGISNVVATATTGNNISGIIWGRTELLVSNLVLYNVTIASPGDTFDIYNAQGIQIINSPLTSPDPTADTLTLYNAQITTTNSDASTNLVTLGGLAVPAVNNIMAFYNTTAVIDDTNMLGTGAITLGGSSLTFTEDSVSFSNGLGIISPSTLAMTSGSNSYDGAFSGTGPLSIELPAGASLALLGDSSGFSGGLIVNDGTLLVNNTAGSGTGSGAVTVLGAATLEGSGLVGGPLTVDGTLAPGNGSRTLTVGNDLVINGGATLQYELGTSSDLIAVNGNLSLGGALEVSNAGGFGANDYTLFTYTGSLNGNISMGVAPPGFSYYLSTNTPGQVILVAYSPTSTAPEFGAIHSSGSNVVMSGSGGSTNGPFYVLTSTNIALPRGQWTLSAFGQFDSNGNFVFTNSPGGNPPQQFYILQLP